MRRGGANNVPLKKDSYFRGWRDLAVPNSLHLQPEMSGNVVAEEMKEDAGSVMKLIRLLLGRCLS